MSLEELLRSRVIHRIRPSHGLAVNSLKRAQRDIGAAKTLIENGNYDWSLAISHNAMLQGGRALMFERGYAQTSVNRAKEFVFEISKILKP